MYMGASHVWISHVSVCIRLVSFSIASPSGRVCVYIHIYMNVCVYIYRRCMYMIARRSHRSPSAHMHIHPAAAGTEDCTSLEHTVWHVSRSTLSDTSSLRMWYLMCCYGDTSSLRMWYFMHRRIRWCQRPCACIDLNWVSPRMQSHLIILYDYVIKTVSLYASLSVLLERTMWYVPHYVRHSTLCDMYPGAHYVTHQVYIFDTWCVI